MLKSASISCYSMKQEVCPSDNDNRDRSVCKMDMSLHCSLLVAYVHDMKLKSILAKTNEPDLQKVKVVL
jgi:hypothetical protein